MKNLEAATLERLETLVLEFYQTVSSSQSSRRFRWLRWQCTEFGACRNAHFLIHLGTFRQPWRHIPGFTREWCWNVVLKHRSSGGLVLFLRLPGLKLRYSKEVWRIFTFSWRSCRLHKKTSSWDIVELIQSWLHLWIPGWPEKKIHGADGDDGGKLRQLEIFFECFGVCGGKLSRWFTIASIDFNRNHYLTRTMQTFQLVIENKLCSGTSVLKTLSLIQTFSQTHSYDSWCSFNSIPSFSWMHRKRASFLQGERCEEDEQIF